MRREGRSLGDRFDDFLAAIVVVAVVIAVVVGMVVLVSSVL